MRKPGNETTLTLIHIHTHEHMHTHTHTRTHTRYGWSDGLFDVTWSEVNEAILVAAAGDGNVLLFDQSIGHVQVSTKLVSGMRLNKQVAWK